MTYSRILLNTSLGELAKLRKVTLTFVMSVRLSIRPPFCPHGTTLFPLDGFL
jgi:hypothetical protein